MDDQTLLAAVVTLCDEDGHALGLQSADIDRWANACRQHRTEMVDRIARLIAFGFHNGEMSFETCDQIANDLYGAVVGDEVWPALFWNVYLAFDAGEYHRLADKSDDPVANFTRPLIADLVARIRAREAGCGPISWPNDEVRFLA